jgi:hypothetical protein
MPNRVQTALRAAAEAGIGLWAAGRDRPGDRQVLQRQFLAHRRMDADHERVLRSGPNPAGPATRGHDWFLGDGMVHGLAIAGGRALWYRNRWIPGDRQVLQRQFLAHRRMDADHERVLRSGQAQPVGGEPVGLAAATSRPAT